MRAADWTVLTLLALGACGEPDDTDDTGSQDTDTGEDTDTDTDTGPVNQAPTAVADTVLTDEDTPTVTIHPVDNDTDPDGNVLTIVSIDDSATTGSVSLEGNLTVLWHPGASFQVLGADVQGTDSFTYTVTDGALTSTTTVTINVTGVNDPPVLTTPANRTDDEGTLINVQVVVADPDDTSLSWSATGLPSGVTLNPTTGRLQGRISASAAPGSPYSPQISVNDGTVSDAATFTWNVTEANVPPLFEDPGAQTNDENDGVSLQIVAEDPEGVTPLAWSASGLPPGLSIDGDSGLITGTVTYAGAANSPYDVLVTASDGVEAGEQPFTWTIGNVNRLPDLTSPGTQSDAEGDAISLSLSATDPDADDDLQYSASGLPAGLSVDEDSGEIAGTISYDAAGPHSVTVEVSDGTDTDDETFTWSVSNTNRLPVFTEPGNQAHAEGEAVSVPVSVTDPDGDDFTLSAEGLPNGLQLEDSALVGTIKHDAEGVAHVTLTAEDPHGQTQHEFDWTIAHTNVPPQFDTVSGRLDDEGDTITPFSLPVSDYDDDDLTFTAEQLPPGITINADTGVMSGTISYDALGSSGRLTFQVSVVADDGVDTDSTGFDWAVDATNRAPSVEDIGDQGQTEGDEIYIPVTAEDPDGDDVGGWTASGLPPSLDILTDTNGVGYVYGTLSYSDAAGSPYTFTLTVYDEHGLSGQATYQFTVADAEPPPCPRLFTDASAAYGFDQVTKGGTAVAWFDADADGAIDVFVRNSGLFLYEEDAGQFVDVSGEYQISPGSGAYGVAVGDPNIDGFYDLFVPEDGNDPVPRDPPVNRLYINQGIGLAGWFGFADEAAEYKVDVAETTPGASAFEDADGDGDHDLTYLAEVGESFQWRNDALGPPFEIEDRFEPPKSLGGQGLAWADFDESGTRDLYVVGFQDGAEDGKFYFNDGDKWIDDASAWLINLDHDSQYGGPTWVDLNEDGVLDLHIVVAGSLGSDVTYTRTGTHFVSGNATDQGLGESEERNSSANWFDYDLDGDLDAFLPDVGLFRNDGHGDFTDATEAFEEFPSGIRAGAWADLDGDLFPELLVASNEGLRLFANGEDTRGGECGSVGSRRLLVLTDADGVVEPGDEQGEYAALGATVYVDIDGDDDFKGGSADRLAILLIGQAQSGRAAVNDLFPVVGFGTAESVDVRVVFPDGTTITKLDVPSSKTPLTILDE